jgi:alanine racemase
MVASHDSRAAPPIVGAVCMDLTMVDLTDVPGVEIGDRPSCGRRWRAVISVNDVARLAQTISYEMLCTVGPCRAFTGAENYHGNWQREDRPGSARRVE